MSRNHIEPAGDVKDYATFTSDIDLTSKTESPIATQWGAHQLHVATFGTGNLTVTCVGNKRVARQLVFNANNTDALAAFYTSIVKNGAGSITGGDETFDLDDGDTLLVKVDGGSEQTATFNTGDFSDIDAATAAEVKAKFDSEISGATATDTTGTLSIATDDATVGGSIEVTGGTAAAKLGFTVGDYALTGVTDVTRVRVGWPSNL